MAKKKDLKKKKKIEALKKAAKKVTKKNIPNSSDLEELLVPSKK